MKCEKNCYVNIIEANTMIKKKEKKNLIWMPTFEKNIKNINEMFLFVFFFNLILYQFFRIELLLELLEKTLGI